MKKAIIAAVVIIVAILFYFQFLRSEPVEKKVFESDIDTLRTLSSGQVVGFIEENGSHAWLGIPYAQAPIGELRWKAPRPVQPWTEVREATKVGCVCTQIGNASAGVSEDQFGKPVGSEDCLYLNVWAPPFKINQVPMDGQKLPVMFWIHGGGNTMGHGAMNNGRVLAVKYNVIVVSFNYRLGFLGWFRHPALRQSETSAEDQSGNFGTLDMIQALKWTKENISNFGGDPNNVTIFGESAGAIDTLSLLISPKAKGLFHRVVAQSGVLDATPVEKAENYVDDPIPGERFSSREVINQILIDDKKANNRAEAKILQDSMALSELEKYIRSKSSYEILSLYIKKFRIGMLDMPPVYRDGVVIPKGDPFELLRDTENYNDVPILIGTNRDEFKLFMSMHPEYTSKILGFYLKAKEKNTYNLVAKYLSEQWKATGVDKIASTISSNKGPKVYVYRFDWDEVPKPLGMDLPTLLGAAHAFDVPFVFNDLDDIMVSNLVSDDNVKGMETLSNIMSSYWAEFAYSGAPGKGRSGNLLEWKAWNPSSPESEKMIIFDTEEDGGVRMSNYYVTLEKLKERIIAETSFKSQKKHCEIYTRLLKRSELWDDQDYLDLGPDGCGADCPQDQFPYFVTLE